MTSKLRYIVIIVCVLIAFGPVYALETSEKSVKEALNRLDKEVAKRDVYITQRQRKIDSLKTVLKNATNVSDALSLKLTIGNEYIAFNNDSAIAYYDKGYMQAIAAKNDSLSYVFKLKRATFLPLAGFISEAVTEYEQIDTTQMPQQLKELYYEAGKQMYSYIASFHVSYKSISDAWRDKSIKCQISLLNILDKKSVKYKLNIGEYYLDTKQFAKSKAILNEVLSSLDESNNLFARASHAIATIAAKHGKENEHLYHLALSAIADIKSATLEVVSMQELGEMLMKRGEISRAHKYSSIALANAVKCKATMRMIQSSEAMPVIEQAHSAEIENWHTRMIYVNVSIAIIALIFVALLIYLRYKMKRLDQLRENLKHANNVKEVYITQFLSLCSIYMDKLNQFSNIVNRKISAGKTDDLYKITKSGKFIEEQSKEFYSVFDDAFLNIYPNFIENVNALLLPDQQIELKEEEKLNTDLRILALMRLGIEESTRIAQMLNYSVNTIYAYRNKLKNKAIDRENFEKNIMKIASIS